VSERTTLGFDLAAMRAELKAEEGLRLRPYRDTVGKLTIGYGRNLDDYGISQIEAEDMLDNDIADRLGALSARLSFFSLLHPVRQRVLVGMAFQMGVAGLLGFHRTLDAIRRHDYQAAANHMLESLWARQTPQRAQRLAAMMRTAKVPEGTRA
jgi:lysozyme